MILFKKYILFAALIFNFVFTADLQGQICYNNGVTFSSQAEIDLFPSINPGCKIIGGDLTLNGADINNLDSLFSIEKIDGGLKVFSSSLTNFEGLNNLDTINGPLTIQGGQSIVNCQGLESVKKIGTPSSSSSISSNGLVDFSGLDSVTIIEGSVNISDCQNLTSFQGLGSVTSIGQLDILDCFNLNSMQGLNSVQSIEFFSLINTDISNFEGMESLQTVSTFNVSDLASLINLNGLSSLSSVDFFYIDDCVAMTSLDGLENLNAVNGNFAFRRNNMLSDVSALENADLSGLNVLLIYDNPVLSVCNYSSICAYLDADGNANIYDNDVGCNGSIEISEACCISDPTWCPEESETCFLSGVTFSSQAEIDLFPILNPGCKIVGGITINGSGITNLDSLISIEKINGGLKVFSSSLTNFEGLNNLDTINGPLTIQGGQSIVNCQGLESVKKIGTPSSSSSISSNGLVNFSGLDSVTIIEGSVNISDCQNLTSMQGLGSVTSIGDLNIYDCFNLTSLQGLNSLQIVDFLSIFNLAVSDLDGLESLQTVSTFDLSDLLSLTNINGLSNLTSVDFFYINDCVSLTSLDGLENLNTVSGNFAIRRNDVLSNISALENADFSGLNSLLIYDNPVLSMCNYSSICAYLDANGNANIYDNDVGCNGSIEISEACCISDPTWCPEESETCFLSGVTFSSQAEIDLFPILNPGCKIVGGITINGSGITNLDSLISIEKINGGLKVFSSSLTNFEGLNNLDTINGPLTIQGGQSIVNCQGLESVKKIGTPSSSSSISSNGLVNFSGLDSVTIIEGSVNISDCQNLTSMQGLGSVTSIGDLNIYDCFNLTSLQGLNSLQIVDFLSIFNLAVSDLDGLESLQTVSTFDLSDLLSLTNINGLSNLTSVDFFYINDCVSLTSLDGLENLNTVSGNFAIRRNDVLSDISAIENADLKDLSILSIYDNPMLEVCNQLSICQYLSDDGNTNIYNNSLGCNGILEIQYDCQGLLSVFETIPTSSFYGNSTDNYWHNPNNWRNNTIPSDSSYVIIPPGDNIIVQQDSVASCQILDVRENATITIESGAILNVLDIE